MNYKVTRKCKDCNNIDSVKLTKYQAAFELYDFKKLWNTPCKVCSSVNCASIGHHPPQLDKELLDLWGNNNKLHLMPQSEELLLAKIEFLNMILNAIDENNI